MLKRRGFIQLSSPGVSSLLSSTGSGAVRKGNKPIVISTWAEGIAENSINCCVGLGANPDRDGIVTLDPSIMDENRNAGCVAAIERIKHPMSVARRVMEKTVASLRLVTTILLHPAVSEK
ncbi:MAG: glycosylasparaginase [Segetibacter sp.]|nr:glycosylasparaginase [Segetibacter sp.]